MFPLQNHHQATFVYGPEIYEKLIPEDHILCRINKQSVDATHVIANSAIPGTIGLIRQGIKAIMEEIETVDQKLFEELGGKKTADKKEKIHTMKLEEKKKKLVEVVEEARAIRGKAEKLESPSVDKKIEQLNQILNENVEEKKGKVQKKEEHVKDKFVNIVDTDARHGAKSDSKPFTGYKANIMKSDDGFVTNIIGTAGNTYDG